MKNILVWLNSFKNNISFNKIQYKIIFLIWGILIFSIAVFLVGIIPFQRNAALERMNNEAKDITSSISLVTATAIISEDYSFAVDHCNSVLKQSESLEYIIITKHDGFSLIHNKETWNIDTLNGFWKPNELNQPRSLIQKNEFSKNREIFSYTIPFSYSGINWGWIHVGLSLKKFNSDNVSTTNRSIILALVCIVIGFISSFYFTKKLIQPIKILDDATKNVAKGNLSVRTNLKTGDELQSLGDSFNIMTEALSKSRNEILASQNELEQRVLERTQELENLNTQLSSEIITRATAEEKIKASLQEKEVLLKEIHHRVKNNLQVISSLLYLQSNKIKEIEYKDIFNESQNRIKSMALVHEKLYKSEDLAGIELSDYIHSLVNSLMRSYNVNSQKVKPEISVEDINLSIDKCIPFGLIINELVTNSLKYAFIGRDSGLLKIVVNRVENDKINFSIQDNGIGMPEDFDIKNLKSLGLRLVQTLVTQLEGTFQLNFNEGTEFIIEFNEFQRK